jgi:hypothetical protein
MLAGMKFMAFVVVIKKLFMKIILTTSLGIFLMIFSADAQKKDTVRNDDNRAIGHSHTDPGDEPADRSLRDKVKGKNAPPSEHMQNKESNREQETEGSREGVPSKGKKYGPNGEATFQENGRYYYTDKNGKRVEVEESKSNDTKPKKP